MDVEAVRVGLAKLPLWGQPGIDCGIRASFRCEYCDRDLLASLDDYKAWAQDHIVPRKRGGGDGIENLAASCHPCNSAYKKDWDPRAVVGAGAGRHELILAAREFVAAKRAAELGVLDRVRELVSWRRGASLRP
jgi:hypothetical protein